MSSEHVGVPCGLQASDRSNGSDRLARDARDHFEIRVVVADRDPGDFGGCGHEKVRDLRLPVAAFAYEFVPHVGCSLPGLTIDGQLCECAKVTAKLLKIPDGLGCPQKLHHNHLTGGDFVRHDAGLEVLVASCGLMPVCPGARVRQFQGLRRDSAPNRDWVCISRAGLSKRSKVRIREVEAPLAEPTKTLLPDNLF